MPYHPSVTRLLNREHVEQHSPEWYTIRKTMLTASDVGSATGDNPYKSREALLKNKLGYKKHQFSGNAATRWGNDNEDMVCHKYEKERGKEVMHFGLITHQVHKWLGASPDGVSTDGILIEIKCPTRRAIKPGEVPPYYLAQVQTLMEVMDLEMCHFVQWQPANGWVDEVMDVTEIKRDREWWRVKFPHMESFMHEWRRREASGEGERAKHEAEGPKKERKVRMPPPVDFVDTPEAGLLTPWYQSRAKGGRGGVTEATGGDECFFAVEGFRSPMDMDMDEGGKTCPFVDQ